MPKHRRASISLFSSRMLVTRPFSMTDMNRLIFAGPEHKRFEHHAVAPVQQGEDHVQVNE
jgi:hypothetical protein